MQIYKAPIVAAVQKIHQEQVFSNALAFNSIYAHLSAYATTLYEQVQEKSSIAYSQINNYHPDYLGVAIKQLENITFTLEDCQLATAANFSYSSWSDVLKLSDESYDLTFETAVNYLINGDSKNLEQLLDGNPDLVSKRSQYGHKATLLHYVGSNGVEMWRQQVPNNLPEVTKLMLQIGADKDAKMQVYGGNFTTLELLKTSAHPFEAGLGEQMVNLLS